MPHKLSEALLKSYEVIDTSDGLQIKLQLTSDYDGKVDAVAYRSGEDEKNMVIELTHDGYEVDESLYIFEISPVHHDFGSQEAERNLDNYRAALGAVEALVYHEREELKRKHRDRRAKEVEKLKKGIQEHFDYTPIDEGHPRWEQLMDYLLEIGVPKLPKEE